MRVVFVTTKFTLSAPRAYPHEGGCRVGQVSDLPVAAFSEGRHGGTERA